MSGIAALCDEGYLAFDNGLKVIGSDLGHVTLFELSVGPSNVDIINDGPDEAPLDLRDLQKIFKRLSGAEEITLEYDSRTLTIKTKINNRRKTFKTPTIDLAFGFDSIPDMSKLRKLPLDSVCMISVADFEDGVKDCELYSDVVVLGYKDSQLSFTTENHAIGSAENVIDIKPITNVSNESGFSLLFIKKIIDNFYNSDMLIMFAKDYPLAIHDMINEDTSMIWYLAPIVMDTEDDDYYD